MADPTLAKRGHLVGRHLESGSPRTGSICLGMAFLSLGMVFLSPQSGRRHVAHGASRGSRASPAHREPRKGDIM
jgi:hypothetical protein